MRDAALSTRSPATSSASASVPVSVPARVPVAAADRAPILDVSDLASRYGRIPALAGVCLQVHPGELVALIGANGAGKTTLLRVLSGVLPACGGVVRFDGADITCLPAARRVRAGIVQVPEGRQVFAPLCVEDNLRLGAFVRPAREVAAGLARVYALFPALAQRRRQSAGTLSGGQQQMLAIGRALMARPRLLLLDEPSMGLAPRLVADILATIESLRNASTAILLADQNAHAVLGLADRAYVLETGRIAFCGTGRALADDPRVRASYLGA
jgi:branched-chain amino acid transport system ATP-binding protein